jgi:short-subunit dehydrogenase
MEAAQMPRRKPTPPRHTALITGASAGIGREIAREFGSHGFDLVLVARRRSRLAALKRELEPAHGIRVRVLEADLYDPAAIDGLQRRLARTPIDVLVNNAGTLEGGPFASADVARIGQMLHLNIDVLVALTRTFVPAMLRRGHGRIVNLASIAAFAPVPWLAVYAATKSFVLSFSEALDQELRGSGVSVTAVCPGLTRSEMTDAALERAPALAPWRPWLFAEPTTVARATFEGCMKHEELVVPGAANVFYGGLMKLTPRPARRRMTSLVGRVIK